MDGQLDEVEVGEGIGDGGGKQEDLEKCCHCVRHGRWLSFEQLFDAIWVLLARAAEAEERRRWDAQPDDSKPATGSYVVWLSSTTKTAGTGVLELLCCVLEVVCGDGSEGHEVETVVRCGMY